MNRNPNRMTALAVGLGLALGGTSAEAAMLTLFHNNDGESKLFNSGTNLGGAAFFKTVLDGARNAATTAGRDVLTVSSGDNFLAGLAFTASLGTGPLGGRTYYDAIALKEIGYDAITIGNHDFDFGPDVLADFVSYYDSIGGTAPFISANLDFSGESALQAQVTAGNIAKSTIVTRGGNTYGIIGVTTETLPTVSRPESVIVTNVLAAVQAEVAALQTAGVNKIILSSHLQGISAEQALIPQLSGVDIVIAGGGDEYLINPGVGGDRYSDTLDNVNDTPDDGFERRFGGYPLTATDLDGKSVAIVTTVGEYRYVGKLEVDFDAAGNVTSVNGNPLIVDQTLTTADPTIQAQVLAPLTAAQNALSQNIIGQTDVGLNGRRGQVQNVGGRPVVTQTGIRNSETGLGDLIADAFIWQAQQVQDNGLTGTNAVISLTNGGGIRNDNVIAAGSNISERTTIDILPFDNYVSVIPNVSVAALKDVLENAVSRVQFGDGRFAQIGGFRFIWDPSAAPMTFATAANTMDAVNNTGNRVKRIEFLDGSEIWDPTTAFEYAGLFDVVTNSFVALGGDGYDFTGANTNGPTSITNVGFSYQQALFNYIKNGLNGQVSGSSYPLTGAGRIQVVPVPAAAWLFGSALVGLALRGRRRQG